MNTNTQTLSNIDDVAVTALNPTEALIVGEFEPVAQPVTQVAPVAVPPAQDFSIETVGEHHVLVVRLLIQEPRPSSTGKTLLLATANGPVGFNFGDGAGKPMRLTASLTVPAK